MRKLCCVFVATALATVLAVSVAQAQNQAQKGGRPKGPRPAGPMMTFMLLRNENVREDLKLTDKQTEDLTALAGELRGMRDLSREERQAKMQDIQKQVDKILKPEQCARLKQIQLQREGGLALANPEIAKALNITAEQKQKLAAIHKSVTGKMRGLASLDRSERREKMAEIRKDAGKQALEVLTTEQRAKFDKMQGKKLEMD